MNDKAYCNTYMEKTSDYKEVKINMDEVNKKMKIAEKEYLENRHKMDEAIAIARLDNDAELSEIDKKRLDDVCKGLLTPDDLKKIWIKEAKEKYGV